MQYPADFAGAAWSMWSGYLAPWFTNLNGHEEDTYQLVHRSDYDENAAIAIKSPGWSEPLRSLYSLYCKVWTKIPVLSTLSGPGIYTWRLAIAFFCIWRNRQKGARRNELTLVLPFLVLGICLLSPVAACMRYCLPVVMMMPLVLGAVANLQTTQHKQ